MIWKRKKENMYGRVRRTDHDAFEEEKISSEEFDILMKRLMDIDCE